MADVAKLGKKLHECIAAYDKEAKLLAKLEKQLSVHQKMMKSGDPSLIGAAAAKLATLMPKLATQQKKVEIARKKMGKANAELAKSTKGD
ncbi:hypothetical protein RA28_05360 [Ruegeria sp. ANG-S4]|uniref:hypothetical protein n=1 Tax=Ruegeria sp. ANG-S4 TaxID=1577904 RepID=UPI00057CE977|nr:hypothetical protein [Ruegeria sp. ANG-S4]KIC47119.1 hypothetical protein RA28_05360 [Ruegeria sp. ANG-S4]